MILQAIGELMENEDWHFHVAALQTIIQTAEGCCLQFRDHVDDIISCVLPSPRVVLFFSPLLSSRLF